MEEKYTKFCKTFHKKLKNDKNLILCSNSLSDYRLGRKKKSNTVSKPEHLSTSLPTMSDHRKAYPSLSTNTGNTYRNESMQYTGTLVRGIATMHKSNAVPVIDEQQMQEISRMRRG